MENLQQTHLKVKTSLFNVSSFKVPELLQVSYLPSLDGFRAFAILIVVLQHILLFDFNINVIGSAGVTFFFVISGFLITTLLLKEKIKTGTISMSNFYIRRALRILPVAYLYLLVVFCLNHYLGLGVTTLGFLAAFFYFKNFTFLNLGDWYTGHYWSLSVEEQFYLLFPAILRASPKKYLKLLLALIFTVPCLSFLYIYNKDLFVLELVEEFCPIFIGSVFAVLLFSGTIEIRISKIYKSSWFNILLLIAFLFFHNVHAAIKIYYLKFFLKDIVSSVIACLLIAINISNNDSWFFKMLNNKLVKKVGVLSYSIYIWQQLFTYNQPWQHSFKYGGSIWLNLILLFVVAYISYTFFEKRFLKLKNRFK